MIAGTIQEVEEKKFSFGFYAIPAEKRIINPLNRKKNKVILLAGPTGTGKTELSLLLAKSFGNCEIISADSMQVYRGMDIGTAKVSSEVRKTVPHHLIDIRNVTENFNVVDFYYESRNALDAILGAGKVPIVVGGSGFYFRALLYGPPDGPPSLKPLREKIEKDMEALGVATLYQKLQSLDPIYAATITKGDRHKIARALEIISLTGEPVSKFSWKCRYPCLDYQFHCWFIYRPREILYKMLEERCDQMFNHGLLDEVRHLEQLGLRQNPSASQAIGYRQCLKFLASQQTPEDLKLCEQEFKTSSRQYAKKQFTWFRKEPPFRWLNVDLHDLETAADIIQQDYHRADPY